MRVLVFLVVLLMTKMTTAAPADWWAMKGLPSGLGGLLAVMVHPADPNVLYLTWDSTVSFDGGQTWEEFGRWGGVSREFSPDPSDPLTVYMITQRDFQDTSKQLVRITWNGGPNQEVLGERTTFDGGVPSSVLVHPSQPRTLYVGTSKGDLFRSDDRGVTWQRLYHTPPENVSWDAGLSLIVVPPAAPSRIYFNDPADRTSLYRSLDGGETWQSIFTDQDQRYIQALSVASRNPEVLDLIVSGCGPQGCSEGAVYRSRDGGNSWECVLQTNWPRSIEAITSRALAVDPEDPNRIAAAAYEGVYLTENGGRTWTFLEFPIGLYGEYTAQSVAFQLTSPKRLLATVHDVLFALELPIGSSSMASSSWGQVKARFLPLLPETSK